MRWITKIQKQLITRVAKYFYRDSSVKTKSHWKSFCDKACQGTGVVLQIITRVPTHKVGEHGDTFEKLILGHNRNTCYEGERNISIRDSTWMNSYLRIYGSNKPPCTVAKCESAFKLIPTRIQSEQRRYRPVINEFRRQILNCFCDVHVHESHACVLTRAHIHLWKLGQNRDETFLIFRFSTRLLHA